MTDFYKRFPRYEDDSDYNTNSPSYYQDLARKNKLLKLLAEKIWEYDERLDDRLEDLETVLQSYLDQWDIRIDNLDDEVSHIFVTWLEDGTLEQIINHDVLGNKADKSYVDNLNENVTTQLAQRGQLVTELGFDVRTDGTNTSNELIKAFQWCVDNDYIAIVPNGVYTVGTHDIQTISQSGALVIPKNSTIHLQKGVIFKLENNAPIGTRTVVLEDNVSIHGRLNIDGSSETITNGNEHMAGLFIYGKYDVYIEDVYSYNAYGDNIQISGDASEKTNRIIIDRIKAEKAGRWNLTLETGTNIVLGNVVLDNRTGGVDNNWLGGSCLDIEPFEMGDNDSYHTKIDFLETWGAINFATGTAFEKSMQYSLDIGTLVQHEGNFISFGSTINISNAYFMKDFGEVNMQYASNLKINKARFYERSKRALFITQESTLQPTVEIETMEVLGNDNVIPDEELILNRGGMLKIGVLTVKKYQNTIIEVFDNNNGYSVIDVIDSYNSGGRFFINLTNINDRISLYSFENIRIVDDREDVPVCIIRVPNSLMAQNLKIGNVYNPQNISIISVSQITNNFLKVFGVINGVGMYWSEGNPNNVITADKGSICSRIDGDDTVPSLYIKETNGGSTGWVAK